VLNITHKINGTDWSLLSDISAEKAYDYFMKLLIGPLDDLARVEIVTFLNKSVTCEPWISTKLLKSARTRNKHLKKKLHKNKSDIAHIKGTCIKICIIAQRKI
jgi:hypothetical protein